MNKRQAKKNYKNAIQDIKDGRKRGISITIINQEIVDKEGHHCNPSEPKTEDAHLIRLKRPIIKRMKYKKAL